MAIIGPGAIQENEIAPAPTLEGASEFEYVTIFNPLTDDFAIRVAQDVPINMPVNIRAKTGLIQSENDVTRTYGLDLKNPEFKSRTHIVNDTIIKAGGTINLKGNEAQVAVRQLVNEILQRKGKQRLLSDPTLRREVEDQIIQRRGSIQELMDGNIQSHRQQIDNAINQSNEGTYEPKETRPIIETGQTDSRQEPGTTDTGDEPASQKKRLGRPRKADGQ